MGKRSPRKNGKKAILGFLLDSDLSMANFPTQKNALKGGPLLFSCTWSDMGPYINGRKINGYITGCNWGYNVVTTR